MEGQLNRNTPAGQQIYEICKYPDIKTIVDIGTWNGKGSTRCIYDAIIDSNKKNYKVFSIECSKIMYEEAKINFPIPLNNFLLIYGSLIDVEELYPIRELFKNDAGALKWMDDDIRCIKECNNNVFEQIPEKIDFLIIDGGEFSGELEFKKLYKRCKYIFLHDTTSFKNKNNRQFILNNPDKFELIYDNTDLVMLICKYIENE